MDNLSSKLDDEVQIAGFELHADKGYYYLIYDGEIVDNKPHFLPMWYIRKWVNGVYRQWTSRKL